MEVVGDFIEPPPDHCYCISDKPKTDTSVVCTACGKKYPTKKSLDHHLRHKHGLQNPNSRVCCLEVGCTWRFCNISHLERHLVKCHNKIMDIQETTFESLTAFHAWKQDYEKNHCARFIKMSGSSTVTTIYVCNRSGRFKSNSRGLRKIKTQGSCRSGNYCTARIVLKIKPDVIHARICYTHYGHDLQLGHIALSHNDRHFLANKLIEGGSIQAVLDFVRSVTPENLSRIHLITRRDLLNIIDSFRLRDKVQFNDDEGKVPRAKEEEDGDAFTDTDGGGEVDADVSTTANKGASATPAARRKQTRDRLFTRLIKIHKGREKTIPDIQNHQKSYSMEFDKIKADGDVWVVGNSTDCQVSYKVKKEQLPCDQRCSSECVMCLSCGHEFSCSCVDYVINRHMCAHIHLVARYLLNAKNTKLGQPTDNTPCPAVKKDQLLGMLEEITAIVKNMESGAELDRMEQILTQALPNSQSNVQKPLRRKPLPLSQNSRKPKKSPPCKPETIINM